MFTVAGANLFGQWFSEETIIKSFLEVSTENHLSKIDINKAKLVYIGWSYNILKVNGKFIVSGSWGSKEKQSTTIKVPEECSEDCLVTGNDYSLIIVDTKFWSMWILDLEKEGNIKKVSLKIETPLVENPSKKLKKEDSVIKVSAMNELCLCLTHEGVVYSGFLPSHLDTSHCVGKVCDIDCGYEHCLLLTDAGFVYSWGNGRRLQLGHGNLDTLEIPTEVEALAGIKIVKIKAGGWHSLALSEFGDLYVWGWNDTGQLGIKQDSDNGGVLSKDGMKSYHLPNIVDIYNENGEEVHCNIVDIACGSRHSCIILEDKSLWTSGYNKYGQLGFDPETCPTVSYFRKSLQCRGNLKIMCGPWSTALVKC